MEGQAAKTFKKEELFELVWQEPPTKLANQYNIPYNDFIFMLVPDMFPKE